MVWGQRSQGIDDLLGRLAACDPRLQSVVLMRQRKLDGVKDVQRLCSALASNPHVTELSISAHALDVECAEKFAELLSSPSCHLKALSLGDSTFGDAAMTALCRGIASNTTLTSLDAEHKGVGEGGAGSIGAALSSCSSLQSLQLSRNELGSAGVAELCSAQWTSLRRLELEDVGLGAEGLAALAQCPGMQHLSYLSLSHNSTLGPDAAPHLTELVRSAHKLETLRLAHTRVGDDGAVAVASGFEGTGHSAEAEAPGPLKLTELDMSHVGMTDTGGVALGRCLARPTCSIQNLSLEGNPGITDDTVTAIAACQTELRAQASRDSSVGLRSLALSQTGVSHRCLRALGSLHSLMHVSLMGCKLGSETLAELRLVTGTHDEGQGFGMLQEFVLSGCGLDRECLLGLFELLKQGRLPELTGLEVGGNPGCQGDDMHEHVEALRHARPALTVHWRAGDHGTSGNVS